MSWTIVPAVLAGAVAAAQYECISAPLNDAVAAGMEVITGVELYVLLGVLAGAVVVYALLVAVTTVRAAAAAHQVPLTTGSHDAHLHCTA